MNYYKHKGKDNYFIIHDTEHNALMYINKSGYCGFEFKDSKSVVNLCFPTQTEENKKVDPVWEEQPEQYLKDNIKEFELKISKFNKKINEKRLLK